MKINKRALSVFLGTFPFVMFTMLRQLRSAMDLHFFNGETDDNFYLYRLFQAELFPNDYIADYYSYTSKILGYYWLNYFWAKIYDPFILHRYLQFPLWLWFVVFFGLVSWKIAGARVTWATVVLVCLSSLFFQKIVDGKEHAFAFSFLITILYFVIEKNFFALSALSLLTAVFYPPVSPIAGLCFAILILLEVKNHNLNLRIGLSYIFLLGGACLGLLFYQLKSGSNYGVSIDFPADLNLFPEAGPNGRMILGVSSPFTYVLARFVAQYRVSYSFQLQAALLVFFILFPVISFFSLPLKKDLHQRLSIFIFSSFTTACLIYYFSPADFYRVVYYPIAIVSFLLFPIFIDKMVSFKILTSRLQSFTFVLVVLLYALTFRNDMPVISGYGLLPNEYLKLYDFASRTPVDTKFVGFPGWVRDTSKKNVTRAIEHLPYRAKRSALLTRKYHVPSHVEYLYETRKRMHAIINAYFATSAEPILDLQHRFKLDYLIVEADIFNQMPDYFAPFDKEISKKWNLGKDKFFLEKIRDRAVLDLGILYVIDLKNILANE